MSYVTKQQLIDAFSQTELIQLTDRAKSGVVDDTVLNEAIDKAVVRINGYISPKYTLPLAQLLIDASSLSEMCGYVVRYILHKNKAPEKIESDYKIAIAWLRDVQSGRVSLGEQDSIAVDPGRVVQKPGVSGFDWDAF